MFVYRYECLSMFALLSCVSRWQLQEDTLKSLLKAEQQIWLRYTTLVWETQQEQKGKASSGKGSVRRKEGQTNLILKQGKKCETQRNIFGEKGKKSKTCGVKDEIFPAAKIQNTVDYPIANPPYSPLLPSSTRPMWAAARWLDLSVSLLCLRFAALQQTCIVLHCTLLVAPILKEWVCFSSAENTDWERLGLPLGEYWHVYSQLFAWKRIVSFICLLCQRFCLMFLSLVDTEVIDSDIFLWEREVETWWKEHSKLVRKYSRSESNRNSPLVSDWLALFLLTHSINLLHMVSCCVWVYACMHVCIVYMWLPLCIIRVTLSLCAGAYVCVSLQFDCFDIVLLHNFVNVEI